MEFISRSREMLGSVVEIKLPDASLFDECFSEIARIEATYSRFLDTSLLSKINRELNTWHTVPGEFLSLVKKAVEIGKKTGGNFDITMKTSLDALGYDRNYSFRAKPARNDDIQNPVLIKDGKILLKKEIDFGGFGKGYALDRVAEMLLGKGIHDFYINAGGDIYARGPWTILLEHPDDPERAIGKIELNGKAIACSAPNRRKWGQYHHLLNAKTGMPQNSVKAIFVTAASGLEADAYATGIFTAGFEDGIEFSKKLPVEVLIVSADNKMYRSGGFNAELFDGSGRN